MVLKTWPLFVSMAAWRSASCRASARRIASGCSSQSLVLPSMSVKRKVTVPVGRSGISDLFQRVGDGLLQAHRPALRPRCCEALVPQGRTRGNGGVAVLLLVERGAVVFV